MPKHFPSILILPDIFCCLKREEKIHFDFFQVQGFSQGFARNFFFINFLLVPFWYHHFNVKLIGIVYVYLLPTVCRKSQIKLFALEFCLCMLLSLFQQKKFKKIFSNLVKTNSSVKGIFLGRTRIS